MTAPQNSHPDIYYPEDLMMLTRICKILRQERGCDTADRGAKEIADRAFRFFSSGIAEEEALFQKLRQQA
ncbi:MULTISPECIES: hypothetical protein [unclassified Mesorhizobium]|uniref:hypothetical protein n=1 Tax=unclassified Mesorhizobium TaxID=325217 RepID=UPI0030148714